MKIRKCACMRIYAAIKNNAKFSEVFYNITKNKSQSSSFWYI